VTDLQKLRALAEAATPGEWFYDERGWINATPDENRPGEEVEVLIPGGDDYPACHNARYAAACSPSVVLSLLDHLAAAQALLAKIYQVTGAEADIDVGRDPGDACKAVAEAARSHADWALRVEVERDEARDQLAAAQADCERLRGLEPTREEMERYLGDRDEIPQGDPYPSGWPTIRRCRHCRKPVAGGPTACTSCVSRDDGRAELLTDAAYVAAADQEQIEELQRQLTAVTAERNAARKAVEIWEHIAERDHGSPIETVEELHRRLGEVEAARDELAAMLEPIAEYEMSSTARSRTLARISSLRKAGGGR
jgi:prefoldin subunit 5